MEFNSFDIVTGEHLAVVGNNGAGKTMMVENLPEESADMFSLSSGEQRLCLLARAFVKDPELLILDEPMHGLDPQNCRFVKQIVDAFMRRPHKTLLFVTHFDSEMPDSIDHTLQLTKHLQP